MRVTACGRRPLTAQSAAACLCACTLWFAVMVGGADLLPPDAQLPPATSFPVDAGCPCLSAEEVAERVYANGTSLGDCPDGTLPAAVTMGMIQGPQCLDYRIGSSTCRAWGQITLVCEVHKQVSYYAGTKNIQGLDVEVAKWCNQGWCYVDPQDCASPLEPSSLFPKADLWYSYETCGYVDTYGPRLLDQSLSSIGRSALRYSYPGDDGPSLWRSDTGEVKGSFPSIFQRAMDVISAGSDIEFHQVEITDKALAAVPEMFDYDSSYTACAVMIAYNKTDVCVGPHWSLPERHSMSQFIYSWDGDQVYLMSYAKQVQGSQLLGGIFLPFTADVWVALALTAVTTIVLFAYIEISPRITATFVPTPPAEAAKARWSEKLHGHLTYVTQLILLSIEGVLDFHPEGYNPLSVAGKLLKAGWLMFMVVFMSTYTANLAAILAGQSRTEFASIQDAISKKATICIPVLMMDMLDDLFPGLSALAVPVSFDGVLPAMDMGTCKAGVLYDAVIDVRAPEHCNKIAVGLPIINLPVAMLSQPFVSQHLNLAVETLTFSGITQDITEEYNKIYDEEINGNAAGCAAQENDEDSARLSLVPMSSLFILFFLAAGLAVLCDVFERFCPRLIMRSRAIPFEVADQSGPGHLYLRDEYKDTYSISVPPGLRPPERAFHPDASPDEPLSPQRRWSRTCATSGRDPIGISTPGSIDEMLPATSMALVFDDLKQPAAGV